MVGAFGDPHIQLREPQWGAFPFGAISAERNAQIFPSGCTPFHL